jgi:hypothetical protein
MDVLAFSRTVPTTQAGENRDRRVEAREHVHDRDSRLRRLPAGLARDAHQPRLGLDDEVVAGAACRFAVAEARDGAVHQAWIDRAHLLVTDPERLRAACAEVLDDDVRPRSEPQERGAPRLAAEVERDAPLASVDSEEVR